MKSRLFRRSQLERERILDTIRRALEAQPAVLFAYIHGSFLADRPFHDIDVAVYLDEQGIRSFSLDLASDLEAAVHLPVDVRVLNQAPLGFRYHVFRGKLLFSRDETLRAQHVARTAWRYLDLKPLRRLALKEAMAA